MQALASHASDDPHRCLCRFAEAEALGSRLDAVIDGVAQKMQEWLFQDFEQRFVHLNLLAFDREVNLAIERTRQPAKRHWKVFEQCRQRNHA